MIMCIQCGMPVQKDTVALQSALLATPWLQHLSRVARQHTRIPQRDDGEAACTMLLLSDKYLSHKQYVDIAWSWWHVKWLLLDTHWVNLKCKQNWQNWPPTSFELAGSCWSSWYWSLDPDLHCLRIRMYIYGSWAIWLPCLQCAVCCQASGLQALIDINAALVLCLMMMPLDTVGWVLKSNFSQLMKLNKLTLKVYRLTQTWTVD